MAELEGTIKCNFCGKGEDDVWHITRAGGGAICEECVDVCIKQQAEKGLIPDLRPLEPHYLFKPCFLTKNDIRGEMSLFEYESLTEDDQREAFIELVAGRARKDDLTKLIADALAQRQFEILCRALEENGLAGQEKLREEAMEAIRRPGQKLRPPPDDTLI